jgi:hypothetical protein
MQLCTIAMTTLVTIANTHYDWDRHVWDFHLEHFTGRLSATFAALFLTSEEHQPKLPTPFA